MGTWPFGLKPFGSISDPDPDGRRHFYFKVYFPFQYGNHISIGWRSDTEDDDYEITRIGMGLKESVSSNLGRVKAL